MFIVSVKILLDHLDLKLKVTVEILKTGFVVLAYKVTALMC